MCNFTALDFETASGYRNSICQIGLVTVRNSCIKEKKTWLCRPPENFYWNNFTEIHGISAEMTKNEPSFAKIWPEMEKYISGCNVVAHNGFAFDFICLEQTLACYSLAMPKYTGYDTYRIYGMGLADCCLEYNIELNHHNALSDAMACARLFMMHQNTAV
ncbi:MAG TPA: exonuclease [Spirochaetia bacterium]|nr:exonuclease [Spirochaetia bacterium]